MQEFSDILRQENRVKRHNKIYPGTDFFSLAGECWASNYGLLVRFFIVRNSAEFVRNKGKFHSPACMAAFQNAPISRFLAISRVLAFRVRISPPESVKREIGAFLPFLERISALPAKERLPRCCSVRRFIVPIVRIQQKTVLNVTIREVAHNAPRLEKYALFVTVN